MIGRMSIETTSVMERGSSLSIQKMCTVQAGWRVSIVLVCGVNMELGMAGPYVITCISHRTWLC